MGDNNKEWVSYAGVGLDGREIHIYKNDANQFCLQYEGVWPKHHKKEEFVTDFQAVMDTVERELDALGLEILMDAFARHN